MYVMYVCIYVLIFQVFKLFTQIFNKTQYLEYFDISNFFHTYNITYNSFGVFYCIFTAFCTCVKVRLMLDGWTNIMLYCRNVEQMQNVF